MIRIENSRLSVDISSTGAEIRSIRDKETQQEYIWQSDAKYWNQSAPTLFPFIGRLYEGRYTHAGASYSMPIHGFLPTAEMAGERLSESAARFTLTDTPATRAVYPFRFALEIGYALSGSTIRVVYSVKNTGDEDMHFAIGGHPGFNLPISSGKDFSDYALEFEGAAEVSRVTFSAKNVLVNGEISFPMEDGRLPLRHGLFDDDAIILSGAGHAVTLTDGERGVRVEYPDMDYIGFWHAPKTTAPYLCIEPWSALPGREGVVEEIGQMPGMTRLAPGEEKLFSWSIEIF